MAFNEFADPLLVVAAVYGVHAALLDESRLAILAPTKIHRGRVIAIVSGSENDVDLIGASLDDKPSSIRLRENAHMDMEQTRSQLSDCTCTGTIFQNEQKEHSRIHVPRPILEHAKIHRGIKDHEGTTLRHLSRQRGKRNGAELLR